MMPILSITIPTYRRQKYLQELLESIEIPASCHEEVEVVVSDNRSEYDVEASIVGLGLPFPVRIHINEQNIGATQNFINCVGMARGKYVWILGDDELLEPGAVPKILQRLKSGTDWGLVLLSARNWNCSPPVEKAYANYGEALREVEQMDPEIPLKQTLLSVVVFRRVDYDYALAYRNLNTNYGQTFGMFDKAGNRPALFLSSQDPLVVVREVRAVSDQLPPRLIATQVRFMKYLARRFGARRQRGFARRFLWKNRLNNLSDFLLRNWKRVSPGTYRFFQVRFSKKNS